VVHAGLWKCGEPGQAALQLQADPDYAVRNLLALAVLDLKGD
jgi:hypothetical protein